ncbi:hypothetical protein [Pseudonocardia sp. DLS-67]
MAAASVSAFPRPARRAVVDDDLQVVDALREAGLDERPRLARVADRLEPVVAERRSRRFAGGVEQLARVPTRGRGQHAGGPDVGHVVVFGREPPLPDQVRRQAEHVQLRGHAEGECLREAAVDGVGVGVDQPGQQRLPGAVHDGVGGTAVRPSHSLRDLLASRAMPPRDPSEPLFTVHVTKPGESGAVEIIFRSEADARAYAMDRSRDFRITSASVTRFALAELGTRHPVVWFRDGEEQPHRFHGPERQFYPAGGA